MFDKKGLTAEYKERIRDLFVEDITDDATNEHIDAYIPFSYMTLKKVSKGMESGNVNRVVTHYLLETKSEIEFKKGDIVRLKGKDEFVIDQVEMTLPKKYETYVAMNPKAEERYLVKTLKLYAN